MTKWAHQRGGSCKAVTLAGLLLLAAACGKTKSAEEYIHDAEMHRKGGNISAAIIDLKNALQQNSKNAAARLLLGRLYLELPDSLGAETELLRARQDGADPFETSRALAEAELMLGKPEAALHETENAGAPTAAVRASLLSMRARALLALGRQAEARQALDNGLRQDPRSVDVLSAFVWYGLAVGDLSLAKARLDDAQREEPNSAMLFALRGAVAFASSDFKGSEEAYERMHAIAPWNLSARLGLARAQLAQDKINEAASNLAVVLKAAPSDPNANYLQALAAYRGKDYLQAQSRVERTLSSARDFAPAILLAGATSYALKQFEQANTYLTQYIRREPGNAQARKLLAAVQVALGRSVDAVKTLSAAAQGSNDAELLGMIGVASAQSGDLAAANRYLNEAVKRQPGNSELRTQLGIAQIAVGQTDAGIAELERASEQDPNALRPEIALFVTFLHGKEYDKAIDIGEKLKKSRPSEAVGFDFAGLAQSAKGDDVSATTNFRKAQELHPGDSIANRSLAAIAIRAGDLRAATHYYEGIVNANANDIRAFIDLVALQARDNRVDEIHATLDKAIRANPSDPALHALLGRTFLSEGKARQALNTVEPLLVKNATEPGLLEVAGRSHLALGETEAAVASFKTLVASAPRSSASHRYLAEAYLRSGDLDLAVAEAQKAVSADQGDVAASVVLCHVYIAQGKLDDAAKLAEELAHRHPQEAAIADLQGSVNMARGRLAEATDAFRRAISLADLSGFRIHLAAAQDRAGDIVGAEQTLTAWTSAHPGDAATHLALGDVLLKQKRNGDAEAQYKAVLKLLPENAVAENNVAWVLSLEGKAQEALPHAQHAAELAPNTPQVLDTYGVVLSQNQKWRAAVEILQKALRSADSTKDIQLHLAEALVGSGDRKRARELLVTLLASPQEFEGREKARKLLDELGS